MFWFCKKKTDEQLANALLSKSDLTKKVHTLESELEKLREILAKVNADIPASSFCFDFDAVKVFSVERNVNNNAPVTIIGYFLPEARVIEDNGVVTNDIVREWYLYCNQEQHEKLVEEFRKSKKK
jgi:hypothetical protein